MKASEMLTNHYCSFHDVDAPNARFECLPLRLIHCDGGA